MRSPILCWGKDLTRCSLRLIECLRNDRTSRLRPNHLLAHLSDALDCSMSAMAMFQQLTFRYSPVQFLMMDSSDRIPLLSLVARLRHAESAKCNDRRMCDLLVVSGPTRDYFGPDGMLCGC